jgi:enoyl-CoA hydratase/carnithine racemase
MTLEQAVATTADTLAELPRNALWPSAGWLHDRGSNMDNSCWRARRRQLGHNTDYREGVTAFWAHRATGNMMSSTRRCINAPSTAFAFSKSTTAGQCVVASGAQRAAGCGTRRRGRCRRRCHRHPRQWPSSLPVPTYANSTRIQSPLLNDVLLRIEGCRKPVVAAVRGAAMGGGFELALACHFRCVARDAQFAFPEVSWGCCRAPAALAAATATVGVETAIELMLSGDTLKLEKAQRRESSIDWSKSTRSVCGDCLCAGVGARRCAADRLSDAPSMQRSSADFWATQLRKAAELARGHGPHEHIVRAVQTGVSAGFVAGLAAARQSFEELRVGIPARALRHLFFAERGGKVAGAARVVKQVGVIGSGTMGSGIAISLATAGYEVIMLDTKPEALAAGMKRLAETIDGTVKKVD